MKKKIRFLFFALAICLWTGSAIAASFSCEASSALAQTQRFSTVEKIVCNDPTASLLDEKVAGLFWLTKKMSSDGSQVSAAQKKWLKEKRDVGSDWRVRQS